MNKVFLAEGYLDDDLNILNPHRFRRLFICVDKELIFAKTNISTSTQRNHSILLDDIQRLGDACYYHEIYLVGDTFHEIDQESLEELKCKCFEVYTCDSENFNKENILKNFTK